MSNYKFFILTTLLITIKTIEDELIETLNDNQEKEDQDSLSPEQMQEQIKKLEEMMKGKDMQKLMDQLKEVKNIVCLKSVDEEMANNVEKFNQLRSGSFSRKMIKKIRAQMFGKCLQVLDLKDLRAEDKPNYFENFDLDEALAQKEVQMTNQEKEWTQMLEQQEIKRRNMMSGQEKQGIYFLGINLNKIPKSFVLLMVLAVFGVPGYYLYTKLGNEHQVIKKKKKKEQKMQ